jgi:hypothetical protein
MPYTLKKVKIKTWPDGILRDELYVRKADRLVFWEWGREECGVATPFLAPLPA